MSHDSHTRAAPRDDVHSPSLTRTESFSSTGSYNIGVEEASVSSGSVDFIPKHSPALQSDALPSISSAIALPDPAANEPNQQSAQGQHSRSGKSDTNSHAASATSEWRRYAEPRPVPQVNQSIEDITADINTETAVWTKYVAESRKADRALVENWNSNMDVILIFAGLLSGVLTAFTIEFYRQLKPDQEDITAKAVIDAAQLLRYIAAQNQSQPIPPPLPHNLMTEEYDFKVPMSILWLNALWFTSLAFSLGAAVLAMVVKQWVQFYLSDRASGNAHTDALHRQYRFNALHRWKIPTIIAILPLFLHISVGLFLVGLIIVLWDINHNVCIAVLTSFSLLAIFYITTLLMPLFDPSCPYRSTGLEPLQSSMNRIRIGLCSLIYRAARPFQTTPNNDLPGPIFGEKARSISGALDWIVQSCEPPSELAREAMAPAYVERQIVESKHLALDLDSVLWLIKESGRQKLVDMGLMCLAKLRPADSLVDKCLALNIQSLLIHKAKPRLLGSQHGNWKKLKQAFPQNLMHDASRMSNIGKYMQSLMCIWHHPSYFGDTPPEPISNGLIWGHPSYLSNDPDPPLRMADFVDRITPQRNKADPPRFLLGNLLKLWRGLIMESSYVSIEARGWLPDVFALVVCTEAHYYHLVKEVQDVSHWQRPSISRVDIDDPRPWSDLHALITDYVQDSLRLTDDTLERIIDTYTYIISRASSSHALLSSEALSALLELSRNRITVYDPVLQKLIFCLTSFMFRDNPKMRRKRGEVYWQNGGLLKLNRTQSYEGLCATLYSLITGRPAQLVGRQDSHMQHTFTHGLAAFTSTPTATMFDSKVQQTLPKYLLLTLHTMDYPLPAYDDFFVSLPRDAVGSIIHLLDEQYLTEWPTPEAVLWHVNLFCRLIQDSTTLAVEERVSLVHILGDLLGYTWDGKLLGLLCDKIVPFWVVMLQVSTDHELESVILLEAVHLLRAMFDKPRIDAGLPDKTLLLRYIEHNLLKAAVNSLKSDRMTGAVINGWHMVYQRWEAELLLQGQNLEEETRKERQECDQLKAALPTNLSSSMPPDDLTRARLARRASVRSFVAVS